MTTTDDVACDYSIVIPVYYNEGCLSETMASLKNDVIAQHPDLTCEVIFVDDGSGDGSLNELLRIREENPKIVKVIKLTRNFGQPKARLAGLSYAKGKCVATMSADGQDPAVLINEMLKAHFEEQFEIVICTRQGRDESWYRILTSRLFYALMKKLSFPNMPPGGFDFVLLGRRALDVLLRNQEAHPFFQGQILWMGFKTKFIEYRRLVRKVGRSHWTFGKKLTYLIDGVMSYSFLPMRLMSGMGILAALLGFLWALRIFINFMVRGNPVKGWSPLMIVILVMGGLQMLMLGVIGEYLWRTLAQVRNREPYIIETIYDDAD
jgi:glycosyltransferase involved in cell wall biosynthesis